MMKASDIRDWDDVEIRARLGELREEKFRLRFRRGTMELENPKMVQHIRRDLARLNTILRERELAKMPETTDDVPQAADETPETTDETPEGAAETSETTDETPPEATDGTPETTDETPETAE